MAKTTSSRLDKLAAIREKIKHTDLGQGGAGFWSPKEGKSVIRILPPVGDMASFFQTVGKHSFPPDGKKTCYCPKFTSEDALECPVCEMVDQLYKGDKASKEIAGDLRVRRAYWMNIVVRGNSEKGDEDKGPFIFTPGVTVFGDIVNMVMDDEYGDIYDLEEGLDLIIIRKGTGFDTKYDVKPKRNSTPLSDDPEKVQQWMDEAKDLSYVELTEDPEEDKDLQEGKVLWVLPYNRLIEEMGLGEGLELEAGDDNDDDDAEPVRKPSKPAAKPAAAATAKASVSTGKRKPEPEPEPEEAEEAADEDVAPAKREVTNRLARRSTRR